MRITLIIQGFSQVIELSDSSQIPMTRVMDSRLASYRLIYYLFTDYESVLAEID